jgi:hypothetical protein
VDLPSRERAEKKSDVLLYLWSTKKKEIGGFPEKDGGAGFFFPPSKWMKQVGQHSKQQQV